MFQNDEFEDFDIRSVCLGSRGIGGDIDGNVEGGCGGVYDGGGGGSDGSGRGMVSLTTHCGTGAAAGLNHSNLNRTVSVITRGGSEMTADRAKNGEVHLSCSNGGASKMSHSNHHLNPQSSILGEYPGSIASSKISAQSAATEDLDTVTATEPTNLPTRGFRDKVPTVFVVIDSFDLVVNMPKSSLVDDKMPVFDLAIRDLHRHDVVSAAFIGSCVGRSGALAWVVFATDDVIYMFDVLTLGKVAFQRGIASVCERQER